MTNSWQDPIRKVLQGEGGAPMGRTSEQTNTKRSYSGNATTFSCFTMFLWTTDKCVCVPLRITDLSQKTLILTLFSTNQAIEQLHSKLQHLQRSGKTQMRKVNTKFVFGSTDCKCLYVIKYGMSLKHTKKTTLFNLFSKVMRKLHDFFKDTLSQMK